MLAGTCDGTAALHGFLPCMAAADKLPAKAALTGPLYACLAAEALVGHKHGQAVSPGHDRAAGRRSNCHICRLPGRWAINTEHINLHVADKVQLFICWLQPLQSVPAWLIRQRPALPHTLYKPTRQRAAAAAQCPRAALSPPSACSCHSAAPHRQTSALQLCQLQLQQSAISKSHSSLPCTHFSYRPGALSNLPQHLLSGRCTTKARVTRREGSHCWCTAWCSQSLSRSSRQPC